MRTIYEEYTRQNLRNKRKCKKQLTYNSVNSKDFI